nr:hypothetical protein DBT45_11165 [Aerococcus tenax]
MRALHAAPRRTCGARRDRLTRAISDGFQARRRYLPGTSLPGEIMFDTLLLLAGALELPYLAAILAQFNPDLDIVGIDSQDALTALLPALLARARLVGFATPLLVPARILEGMGYGAYNFHPGPPEYRGWHPHCFAVYEGAKTFGVTAHVMSERVD